MDVTCGGVRLPVAPPAWSPSQPSTPLQAGESKTFEQLEATLLGGQKLQGVLTSNEVQEILNSKHWEAVSLVGIGLRWMENLTYPPALRKVVAAIGGRGMSLWTEYLL